jgi:3-hydroxyisobutyrate dehydrogenase-like beta-hydroxyacid dehydrogenase
MGLPVVRHCRAAGLGVAVLDLDPSVQATCAALGAAVVTEVPALAAASDLLLVLLPSDDDVRAACLGSDGLLRHARPGTVVLLCSSLAPATCHELAAAAPTGVGVLDAAMTGGVRAAEAGEVNLLVGGDLALVERVRYGLDPWVARVHFIGPLGAGQVAKTVNNLIHWAQISAITEALDLGRRLGVDVPVLREALQSGPTDSRTLRELEQMRFTWYAKDLATALALAEQVGVDLPMARTSRTSMPCRTVASVAQLLVATGDPAGPLHGTEPGPGTPADSSR